jgi:hypothetical protein
MNLGLSLGLPFSRVAGASFVGPLDAYTTNLAGAWSVARRLLSSYEGSLIRIRRSSDDAEQDIGFDGDGALDTAGITSFVGANSAYISKIYTQSGSVDAAQATALNQPLIVSTGTISVLTASIPCAVFDGTNDLLSLTGLTVAGVRAYAVLAKSTGATWNSYGSFLETSADPGATGRLGVVSQSSTSWHTDPVLTAVRKNGSSLSGPGFNMTTVNAAMALGVDTAVPTTGTTNDCCVGAMVGGSAYYLAASITELVAWSTTADRTAFEANQKAYIGL